MAEPTSNRIDEIRSRDRENHQAREALLEFGAVDANKRTVELSFSSEFPVLRRDKGGREYLEVLDHASVDTSLIKSRAPLLYGHDRRDHLGTILAVRFAADKKGRAVAKFSRSQFAEEKFRDVQDEILTCASVGYDLEGAEIAIDGERDGIPILRFRGWRPYEVTLTPLPADPSVGVGRSKPDTQPAIPAISVITISTMETTPDTTPDLVATERARVKEINAACDQIVSRHQPHADAIRALARKCVETNDGVDVFSRAVMTEVLKTEAIAPTRQGNAEIGMSKKEVKRYSVLRAIQCALNGKPLDGLERECSDEVSKKLERAPAGFFLPDDIVADHYSQKRAMRSNTVNPPSDGGYLVGQELLTSEFVELLRANTKVMELGARYISGLVGDVTIPRQITGASAYWVSETGSITQSNATFGQIIGRPRRIGTSVPYSKQFLAQSSLGAEAFIVNDSDLSIAVDLDRVALRGIGGAEPLGIANLAAADKSTAVTFGGAPTYAKYLEFFANVAANNAILGQPSYLASVASAVKAMATAKFSTGTSDPIWKDDKVGVFRAAWSTQLLVAATPVANMVIFGDFSQVIFLEWAGRDVVVDPYSGKKEGTVEVTIQRLMDCVIRRGKSFSTSADTGAA